MRVIVQNNYIFDVWQHCNRLNLRMCTQLFSHQGYLAYIRVSCSDYVHLVIHVNRDYLLTINDSITTYGILNVDDFSFMTHFEIFSEIFSKFSEKVIRSISIQPYAAITQKRLIVFDHDTIIHSIVRRSR